jgi:tetratricopeptide (TPR) repeat protein
MSRRHAAAPLPQQRTDIEANLMHADWFASQGHTAQAIGLYRTAATAAEARGDRRIALTAYAAVARLEGAGSDAKLAMGRIQAALGHRREAGKTLEEAGNAALQHGMVDVGLSAYRQAADADPTPQRWKRLVDWCVHLGREAAALHHLEEGTAALFAEEAFPQFITVARLLLQWRPNHVPTLRQLVRAHLQRKEIHAAVAAIQAILAERPGDPDALEHMAEAFAALGRVDKAAEVIARLAELMLERGTDGIPEARRLVYRGLTWRPGDSDLLVLRARFLPPQPRVHITRRLPPLDLSEFAHVAPPEVPIEEISEHRYVLIEATP